MASVIIKGGMKKTGAKKKPKGMKMGGAMKTKGYKAGGKVMSKGMKMGGKVKPKGMKMGGKVNKAKGPRAKEYYRMEAERIKAKG